MKCAVHYRDPINTMHFSFIYIIKKRQIMHQRIIKINIDSRIIYGKLWGKFYPEISLHTGSYGSMECFSPAVYPLRFV